MGYLEEGRLGVKRVGDGVLDKKSGRWEDINVREQKNGRNSKLRVTDFVQKIVKLKKIEVHGEIYETYIPQPTFWKSTHK